MREKLAITGIRDENKNISDLNSQLLRLYDEPNHRALSLIVNNMMRAYLSFYDECSFNVLKIFNFIKYGLKSN